MMLHRHTLARADLTTRQYLLALPSIWSLSTTHFTRPTQYRRKADPNISAAITPEDSIDGLDLQRTSLEVMIAYTLART